MNSFFNKLQSAFVAAEVSYFRLILLVGPERSGKTETLKIFSSETGHPLVNLNLALSEKLLELTDRQRKTQVARKLDEVLTSVEGETIILDNIELLFDHSLEQDPLRILQSASRNRTIISSWCGNIERGKLHYAEPGHREYRSYELSDVQVVAMDGANTIDGLLNHSVRG